MDLESTVDKIVKKNPKLEEAIQEHPELRDKLTGIVQDSYDNYSHLVKWAEFNDKVGRILGPAEAGLSYLSPLGSVGFGIYSAAKMLHYGLLKLPYTAYYAAKTRDLKGTVAMTLSEIAKYVVPFGTAADALPMYQATLEHYIMQESDKQMSDYIAKKEQGLKGLQVIQDNVRMSKQLIDEYGVRVANGKVYADVPNPGYELRLRDVGDGTHEVYLEKQEGDFPQVYSTVSVDVPPGMQEMRTSKEGFFRRALNRMAA